MRATNCIDVVLAMEEGETVEAVIGELRSFIHSFGYNKIVLFSASPSQEFEIDRIIWIEGDWFGDGSTVDAKTYLRKCPPTRHVFETDMPFFWTKTGQGEAALYKIVKRPTGAGLHGLQIPVFGPLGLVGGVSFGGDKIEATREVTLALSIAGVAALRMAKRLVDGSTSIQSEVLTVREKEILSWVAAGRRQSDIAVTLGLSERTIENHLRRTRQRLGARTTAEAVRIATRNGSID